MKRSDPPSHRSQPSQHSSEMHVADGEEGASQTSEDESAFHDDAYIPSEGVELYKLIDRLPGAVYRCTYDTAWSSMYMGGGFEDICDLAPETLDPAGRSFKDVVVSKDLDRIREDVKVAVENDTYYRIEYRIQGNDGSVRWVQDNGRPCFGATGRVKWLDGILLDITKRKEAQEGMRKTEAQVEERIEARTLQLRKLSAALTMAEQRERSEIASTVHDDLLQYLYGIQVQLRMLIDEMTEASDFDLEELLVAPSQVEKLLNEAIAAARKLTIDLAPPMLEDDGIIEALQWLRSHLRDQHGFTVELHDETTGVSCTAEVRTVLFRVVRELLLNAHEYAGVESAIVHASVNNGTFRLEVTDDGAGFDPKEALRQRTRGNGLWEARERLRSVDGELCVEASPGNGTCCTLFVPTDASDPKSNGRTHS